MILAKQSAHRSLSVAGDGKSPQCNPVIPGPGNGPAHGGAQWREPGMTVS
jgi:hypothetical protein